MHLLVLRAMMMMITPWIPKLLPLLYLAACYCLTLSHLVFFLESENIFDENTVFVLFCKYVTSVERKIQRGGQN